MATQINTRLQFKKDTADHFNINNPTVLSGEPVINENYRIKLGTGSAYNSTAYLLSKPMVAMPSTTSITATNYDRYTISSGPNYNQDITFGSNDDDLPDIIFPINHMVFYDDKINRESQWEDAISQGYPYFPYPGSVNLNSVLRNGTEITLDSSIFPSFSWQVGKSLDIYVRMTRGYCPEITEQTTFAKIGSITIGSDQKIYFKITQQQSQLGYQKHLWLGTTSGGKGTYVDSVPGDTDTYPDGGTYDGYYYEKNGTTTMPVIQLNNFNYFESCIRLTNSNTTGVQITANIYPIATEITFSKEGSGKNIFMAASGVTLHSPNNAKLVTSQYEIYRLKQIATNEWLLIGG